MKARQDFVSNSSSCSFIIKVASQDDLTQLSKDENKPILQKYATDVLSIPVYKNGYYEPWSEFYGMEDVKVEDKIRIYIGEDSQWWNLDPEGKMLEIFEALNKDYGKLTYEPDVDAHITLSP